MFPLIARPFCFSWRSLYDIPDVLRKRKEVVRQIVAVKRCMVSLRIGEFLPVCQYLGIGANFKRRIYEIDEKEKSVLFGSFF